MLKESWVPDYAESLTQAVELILTTSQRGGNGQMGKLRL